MTCYDGFRNHGRRRLCKASRAFRPSTSRNLCGATASRRPAQLSFR
jgi:hypothetical protein